MTANQRITVDPDRCGGRPCIRNLRVRVKDVLDLLAAGASREEILADYPYLEDEDITAVLEFAARGADHPILRSKTSIEIDEDLVEEVRGILGTGSMRATIEAAFGEVVRVRARREEIEALTDPRGTDLDDPEVMAAAWHE